jgi:hypothetical protein
MRNVINTLANVTTTAIVNRPVRTVLAGVDALRASLAALRLYAAPAPQCWDHADGQAPFAGKQKPAGTGPMPGGSDFSSRWGACVSRSEAQPHCRESSRCRRPRVSSCLARS